MEFQNHKPNLFVIGGKARSGKDTVGSFIQEYYQKQNKKVITLQYSYYIKEYTKKISNWNGEEATKPRELLCNLGTELIRKNIDYLFFVKRTIDDILVYQYFYDIIIITDARFKEEMMIPKKQFQKVTSILVNRPDFDNQLTLEQKEDIIEKDLDDFKAYDYQILNNGSIEQLKIKVEKLIEEVEKNEKINE